MSLQNDLLAAASYLEKYGWRQHAYGRRGGARCVTGALHAATHSSTERDEHIGCDDLMGLPNTPSATRWLDACRYLARHLVVRSISTWNDSQGRRSGEVIDALRAAADQAGGEAP